MPSIWQGVHRVQQDQSLLKSLQEYKGRAVQEVEQEIIEYKDSEDIEMVSVHSVQLNVNRSSIITANLKTLPGKNSVNIKYRIDMGSNGNIMPTYLFKKTISKHTQ